MHFELSPQGRQAAFNAVNAMADTIFNGIRYVVQLSRNFVKMEERRCYPPSIASIYSSGGSMMMYPAAAPGVPGYQPQFMYPSSIQDGHLHGLNYQQQV